LARVELVGWRGEREIEGPEKKIEAALTSKETTRSRQA
jgi:hypothetical protein